MIKASNWDFRSTRHAGFHCFVHILPADYSKVPPKVDCWRKKPKICGECKKVLITGNMLTTRNHQVRSPSLMPPRHGKGAPKKVHSIGPASLPANLSVPLRDGMEKPTHDHNSTSNVSEVITSRMVPKNRWQRQDSRT